MDCSFRTLQAYSKPPINLRNMAQSAFIRNLSYPSFPRIHQGVEEVAKVYLAGKIPAVILNGLARLPDRRLPSQIVGGMGCKKIL